MKLSEITVMLTFINALDGRLQPDQATVVAWSNVLTANMSSVWASEFVKKHYANSGDMVIPSMLNKAWYEKQQFVQLANPKQNIESHCGKSGCMCNHTICYRGWIDTDHASSPCGTCRDELRALLAELPEPGKRSFADQSRILGRGKKIDERVY